MISHVKLEVDGSTLTLSGTDMDIAVIERVSVTSAGSGATTVPAHMFYDIVRKLPDGSQIVLEGDGDRSVLAIRAGSGRRSEEAEGPLFKL